MPPAKNKDGDWSSWRQHVLAVMENTQQELKDLNSKIDTSNASDAKELGLMRTEVAVLKTKLAMIGVGSGGLTGLIVTAIGHFIK